MTDPRQFFESFLNAKLAENAHVLADVEAIFQIQIDDYCCHLALPDERVIKAGQHPEPDCEIQMNQKTFDKMIEGNLNIPLALATRKIKASGNLSLFTKLRELFKN